MTKRKTNLRLLLAAVGLVVGCATAPCYAIGDVFHHGFEPDDCSPDCIPEPGDPNLTEEEICYWASTGLITDFLDYYQSPDDGRVIFCHATGPGEFNYLDVSTTACLPHIDHQADLFPSTICDS